jgi:hypothetical protein
MRADGIPDFSSARGWVPTSPPSRLVNGIRYYDLPGQGDLLSHDITAFPNQTLQQSIWRAGNGGGQQNFYRAVPVNIDGTPRWRDAGNWQAGSASAE